MNILITTEKAKFIDNIDCIFGYGTAKEIISDKNLEIEIYNIKQYFPFILKKEIAKVKNCLSSEDEVCFTDNLPDFIRAEFESYTHKENCFLSHFSAIIKKFKTSIVKENLDIGIISLKSDKAIFQIIDRLKDYSKTVSIVTEDDNFFESISEYAWLKYGMLVNLKEQDNLLYKDLAVILNMPPDFKTDFSKISNYTIDIYERYFPVNTNYLTDFSSFNRKKLDKYMVKMYNFVQKSQKITNFNWKFQKKS